MAWLSPYLYTTGSVTFNPTTAVVPKQNLNGTPYHLMRVYPKVSGLAAWSENCKWYSSLPLDAVVSPFCESV